MMSNKRSLSLVMLLGALVLLSVAVFGCGEGGGTATTSGADVSASSSDGAGTETAVSSGDAAETIRIGLVAYKGWTLGVDWENVLRVMVSMTNDAGGIDVDGKKYKFELITYDSDMKQATAVAAMNRLVFKDKVKYVFEDYSINDPLVSIAEENGVVLLGGGPQPLVRDPANKYSFSADGSLPNNQVFYGWLKTNYPDKKTYMMAAPDNQNGHAIGDVVEPGLIAAGFDAAIEYYPADQQDLSALVTKVMKANPAIFLAAGGSVASQGTVYRALYQGGYRGIFGVPLAQPSRELAKFVPEEALSIMLNMAVNTEFDPAPTPSAQAFKDAWIKEFGEWTDPETMVANAFTCMTAAMQKAGSIEPDAIAAVIGAGLEWESPNGTLRMISSPEGGTRTNESVSSMLVKKTVDGEPVVVDPISLDQAVGWYYELLPTASTPAS